jgi:type IV fimbrial biogenesis protein FimT
MRGFSLIEYMVALAVTSVLLGAAVPSLVDIVQDNRIRAVADEYRDGLSRARMEAVQRNRLVQFDAGGSGWTITIQSTGTVIESRTALNTESRYAITPSAASVIFGPNGRPAPASYTLDVGVTSVQCEAAGGPARCLRVVVGAGGSIRTCDPAVASTDPRSCS